MKMRYMCLKHISFLYTILYKINPQVIIIADLFLQYIDMNYNGIRAE